MGVRPVVSPPAIGPAEMEMMISRAGLVLNAGQTADLVLAWRQIVQLAGMISRERPLADDLATVFRLASPRSKPARPQPARAKPIGAAQKGATSRAAVTRTPPRAKRSAAAARPRRKPAARRR